MPTVQTHLVLVITVSILTIGRFLTCIETNYHCVNLSSNDQTFVLYTDLYKAWVCGPPVDGGPGDWWDDSAAVVVLVDGVHAGSRRGAAVLGVLGERHATLHTVPREQRLAVSAMALFGQ